MASSLKYLSAALYALQVVQAQGELPAAHGPPADSEPLTWGFYATHEVLEPTALEIEGTIPKWMTGSLYRGAASTWDVGNFTAEHWFDGFSRNHLFEIADGGVTYRSRNSSEEIVDFVRETGMYPDGQFGGDPCKIIFGAFETTYRDGVNAHGDKTTDSISVAYIPNFAGLDRNSTSTGAPFDTLVVTTDGNRLQQIDPVTLEPIELLKYQASDPELKVDGRSCAHPSHGSDGSLYNYLLDLEAQPPAYHVFGINAPDGKATILANVTDAPPAYIHSLFGTEKHLVLIVWQADLTKQGKTIVDSLGDWDPERKSLFYVIDKKNGGVVAKYESEDAFFAFHEINTFEDEAGDILVDLPTMKDASFLSAAEVPSLRANLGNSDGTSVHDVPGTFTRYRLPNHGKDTKTSNGSLITHTAEVDFALDFKGANIELPRINEKYSGQAYRYAYGIHIEKPGYFTDSIVKIDTETQDVKVWSPSTNHLPSEPIFVAAPDAECEDDGVLLTVAMDAEARKSSLVFIDAKTMKELGRAKMPIVMGYGFHGVYGSLI